MRLFATVLIGVVLLSPTSPSPERSRLPTVAADTVTIREVRRGSAIDAVIGLADSREMLVVERPIGASEGTTASVFALDDIRGELQRVAVRYGRSSSSLIEIVSGVSHGDRIAVSDMSAWDQFERLRLRSR